MKNRIQILPDYIANQIAAGEVVQRPESVIKECVENSLDAGATSIVVVVRNSGKQLIHIVDNGHGMSKEDLQLSIKRHATSKIISQEDLEHIMTYGFRGEALASISAVSLLEIRTKTEADELGWKLTSDPLNDVQIEAANTEVGTQILVKNLFYNVPARRKFLKSDITEFRYISDTMMKLAISRPDVRFTFYDDDAMIFDVHPANQEQRISEILGSNTKGNLIRIEHENEFVRIEGFVGMPHLSKQNSVHQYFFLNGRSIQNKSLSHAVFSAYEHLLEKNYKPMFVVNIMIDPELVDINVHPQKHEVKFEDERLIYNSIRKAVNSALAENNLTPDIMIQSKEVTSPFEVMNIQSETGQNERVMVNRMTGEILDNNRPMGGGGYSGSFRGGAYGDSYIGQQRFSSQQNSFDFAPANTSSDNIGNQSSDYSSNLSAFDLVFGANPENSFPNIAPATNVHLDDKPESMYWQMHNKYIFTQTDNGILIIDQHNAHERILYEKAVKAMNRELSNSQSLLFPVRLQLSSAHVSVLKEILSEVTSLGYGVEIIDGTTVEVSSLPGDVEQGNEHHALTELLEEYSENQTIRTDKRDNIAASFSCKAAIKTGKKLTQAEMKNLAEMLFKTQVPYVCPHGRPVILEMSLIGFDKMFKRIL